MPRLNRHSDPESPERPPIWVEGRQQPRFKLWAWIMVGQALTRRWLAPRLDRSAARLTELAGQITAGRFKLKLGWLGKAQRFVPSRSAVSARLAGLSARMTEARAILVPPPPSEPIAYPNLIRINAAYASRPVKAEKPPSPVSDTDPAMQAVRAVLQAAPHLDPNAEQVAKLEAKPGADRFLPIEPAQPPRPTLAMWLGAHGIAWCSFVLALPVGLVQATLYYLNGGDLADWD
ncbi:MAG: hypothetical protein ACOH2H_13755 [Cypionkella sp.]